MTEKHSTLPPQQLDQESDGYLMDRIAIRAATIDELLSDNFETLRGQKGDTELASKRLAAWCRACASGDWSLFSERLKRDGLTIEFVLGRFSTVRHSSAYTTPQWIDDARWIVIALQRTPSQDSNLHRRRPDHGPHAFEEMFYQLIEDAERKIWVGIDDSVVGTINDVAHDSLRSSLLTQLSCLCAPILYERFAESRKRDVNPSDALDNSTFHYDIFLAKMRGVGFQLLFEEKPVLLRLIACITRHWIDATRELVMRLNADFDVICCELLQSPSATQVADIKSGISDRHNCGRTVHIITFSDGCRILYKPKDIRLDANWHYLIERLNGESSPAHLMAVKTLSRNGYGWTEFIDHIPCISQAGVKRFFHRAGALLALFHIFSGTDMHAENMIASGDQPVPIDLEMILQASTPENDFDTPETIAFGLGTKRISESVAAIGLLPSYAISYDNKVYDSSGLSGPQGTQVLYQWENINTDKMCRSRTQQPNEQLPNIPRLGSSYAKLGDYIGDLVSGFDDYSNFLLHQRDSIAGVRLFEGFSGLPVRKVVQSTRFYSLLLLRLQDHRNMDDGVVWSAQADFVTRLADWDRKSDLLWPLKRSERIALLQLDVPHFVSPSDFAEISSMACNPVRTLATPGLVRSRARLVNLDKSEITWQSQVIRQTTNYVSGSKGRSNVSFNIQRHLPKVSIETSADFFMTEASQIFLELSNLAIRSGPGAAWIGLDWLGGSEVGQLNALGPDLYNGTSGIAVFLAAYGKLSDRTEATTLALASIAGLRQKLRAASSSRMARSLGLGGFQGMGSIVYALTTLAKLINSDALLADAQVAAQLISDDLIVADKVLDLVGGSAGAILGLLCLYRLTKENEVLQRATKCGEHLLNQPRSGSEGNRSWNQFSSRQGPLNGISHGAAGFAYALSSLSAETGREDFAVAAYECIVYENSSYDADRGNWPDLRDDPIECWPCQWCHGAVGIGLARVAQARQGAQHTKQLMIDVERALKGTQKVWPNNRDTICCGTLGSIELLSEASRILGRKDLDDLASYQMMSILKDSAANGDYQWGGVDRDFNLGLFRGLSGVGYTLLRRVDASLPNVTVLE